MLLTSIILRIVALVKINNGVVYTMCSKNLLQHEMYFFTLPEFIFETCVTITMQIFNYTISKTFLYLQNHPMVSYGRNKLHPREYSRRRANYRQLPYYSRDYG